jgi:hypothetical protein
LDDVSDKLALMLQINKVHFAKMTDFMEQKFGIAVTISKRLIHMAYNNRLSPGALHHEVLLEIVKYINEIAQNSELLLFVHQPSDLFLVETSYTYRPDKKNSPGAACSACHTTQPDATFQIHSASGTLQLLRKHLRNSRGRPLTIVPTHLLFRPPNVQQDGGDLFLQREECPLDRLDQDLPRSLVPRRCQEHPGLLQVLYRWGSGKDLPFGQQHIHVNSHGKINTNHVCPKAKSISAIQISSGQTV